MQTLSVLWRHRMICVACVLCNVQAYTLAQCTKHDVYPNSEPLLAILAKHWLWLPDDGFFVNRNTSEQPP